MSNAASKWTLLIVALVLVGANFQLVHGGPVKYTLSLKTDGKSGNFYMGVTHTIGTDGGLLWVGNNLWYARSIVKTVDAKPGYKSIGKDVGTQFTNESKFFPDGVAISHPSKMPAALYNYTMAKGASWDISRLEQVSVGGANAAQDVFGVANAKCAYLTGNYTLYYSTPNCPNTCGTRAATDPPCSGVYKVPFRDELPYVNFLGGQKHEKAWICPRVVDVGSNSFDCYHIVKGNSLAASTLRYGEITNKYGFEGRTEFNITLTTTMAGENLRQAWQLGWKRLYDYTVQYEKVKEVEASNNERRDTARFYIGIAYGVFGVHVVVVSLLCTFWMSYMGALFGPPMFHWNRRVWFLVVFSFWVVASAAGGFYGQMLVGAVNHSFWIGLSIYYLCKRRAALKRFRAVEEYTDEEMEELVTHREHTFESPAVHVIMKIVITMENGGRLQMQVNPMTQISTIEAFIATEKHIMLDEQRLVFNNKVLQSDQMQTVSDYGIADESKLHCGMHPLPKAYTHFPEALGTAQTSYILLFTFLVLLSIASVGVMYYMVDIPVYKIMDRNTKTAMVEFQPSAVSTLGMGLYAFDGFATYAYVDPFLRQITHSCKMFSDDLDADDRFSAIQETWIDKYSIDMKEYAKKHYSEFSTVNQWFSRKLNQSTCPRTDGRSAVDNLCIRPLATVPFNSVNSSVASAPADSRVMAFSPYSLYMNVWIKSDGFTLSKLLMSDSDAALFDGGSLFIFRLAPQDYHRFHAPVDGKVISHKKVRGTMFSVNADAATSNNEVLLNDRQVVIYNTQYFGKVAQVFIGATCTASITLELSTPGNPTHTPLVVGHSVRQGQDIGKFEFGGSCVVLVFQKDMLDVAGDILLSSAHKVETFMKMGQALGTGKQWGVVPGKQRR